MVAPKIVDSGPRRRREGITVIDAKLRLDADYFDHQHEIFAKLRAEGPAHHAVLEDGIGVWVITRHDDARAALADPRLGKDIHGLAAIIRRRLGLPADEPLPGMYRETIVYQDDPEHRRVRKRLATAFTAKRVDGLRPRIEELTTALLAGLPRGRPVDLIADVAGPLPLMVICELLGVPPEERSPMRAWTTALVEECREQANAATRAMEDYLATLVSQKRVSPGDDLVSLLLGDDVLAGDRLISTLLMLIVAGHETTTNLIGNAVRHLLEVPSRWALLREDPSLIPGAVEELIRFDAPVAMATHRFTKVPVAYGPTVIPAGEIVLVSVLSAGRDEDRYPGADTLDLHRDASGHLGFGHGPHYCLGAQLARLETEIVLAALTREFPSAALAVNPCDLRRKPDVIMNGYRALPLVLGIG